MTKEADDDIGFIETVGCTANVVYLDKENNKIYVVNAGDSRCTMGVNGKAVEMS